MRHCRGSEGFHYTRSLTRIPVRTASRHYEVLVERGLLRSAGEALREVLQLPLETLCRFHAARVGPLGQRTAGGACASRPFGGCRENARRRSCQAMRYVGEASFFHGHGRSRSSFGDSCAGWRRRWRCSRISCLDLHARDPCCAGSYHPRGTSGLGHRRQDRRQPCFR